MISVVQLGTIDYQTGLRLQQRLVELRKQARIGDVVLLLEHPPVITLGRNAKSANIVASPQELAERNVEVWESDRGGDVTFHGPGQLVAYPIFDLRGIDSDRGEGKSVGAVEYVRRLEEVLIPLYHSAEEIAFVCFCKEELGFHLRVDCLSEYFIERQPKDERAQVVNV